MASFEEINGNQITTDIENALNEAINKLNLDEELVFEEIRIRPREELTDNCEIRKVCERDQNGTLVCRWFKDCS